MLTPASGLTDGFAGLAGVGVPRKDLDLDAVLGQVLQVRQNNPVLLDADVSGLKEAAEGCEVCVQMNPQWPVGATGHRDEEEPVLHHWKDVQQCCKTL